ncbi:MAG: helix-turn-helix domain-containing protein [Oscillospiraceae bacterium]|nr:helix-turn-helix domain-containing protein [Oscillospiraceae bacterium]
MNTSFSRSLKLLRTEKGVSQRAAAGRLNISQALLSHYENGAREPGLDFVTRACDYYDVSADYLLGRTMVRESVQDTDAGRYDASGDNDNRLRGSASALMSKRLLNNSVTLLFDLLDGFGDRALTAAVMRYLSAAYYKVFRILYSARGVNAGAFFSVPEHLYAAAAEREMASAEMQARAALAEPPARPGEAGRVSHESLNREHPMLAPSLLNVLHQVGDRIAKTQL